MREDGFLKRNSLMTIDSAISQARRGSTAGDADMGNRNSGAGIYESVPLIGARASNPSEKNLRSDDYNKRLVTEPNVKEPGSSVDNSML